MKECGDKFHKMAVLVGAGLLNLTDNREYNLHRDRHIYMNNVKDRHAYMGHYTYKIRVLLYMMGMLAFCVCEMTKQ